jgi:hypothetical protein
MTEPRRLLSDPRGGLESVLLRAGAEEVPSPRALERTVAAVGAGAATLGVVTAAASAPVGAGAAAVTSLGAAGAVKLLAIGAVAGLASGGALLGVARVVEQRTAEPVPVVAPAVSGVAPLEPAPAPPPVVAKEEPPPAVPAAEPPAPRPVTTSTATAGAPLAAEVALVDRAHGALRGGDARGAVAILAAYESAFASPRLLPEVFALRMQASERAGDGRAARLWAGRLVSRYPRSAQAARARALLEGPSEANH